MVNFSDYQIKSIQSIKLHLSEFLMCSYWSFEGWLIMGKRKRQTAQPQVRDEHPQSSKQALYFVYAF